MHEITALELGLVVKELRVKVLGSYLKKFYDLGGDSFRFSFHGSEGNFVVYCGLLSTLNETTFVEESGAATNFAVAVRKRVEDSKVTDFYQHGSDRIAIIGVQGKGMKHRIIMEMFGKGNLIVVDENNIIELAYRLISYKDREIKPKLGYVLPKSESVAIDELDAGRIENMLRRVSESGNRSISELSKYLNVGPIYLEDILVSAGLNPKERLDPAMTGALKDSILDFLEKIKSPNPIIYMKDDVPVDYSVFPLKRYAALEMEECGSMSEMLDRANIAERSATKNDSVVNDTSEVDAVIAQQRELVKHFNEDSVAYAQCGKRIFERMGEINALIMRIAEKKRPTLEELRKEFPELNLEELSLKDRTVTIEV